MPSLLSRHHSRTFRRAVALPAEREELLPVPQRTDGEHRRYGPTDVERLLFIRGAQRLGLRLAMTRELLAVRDTGTCACQPAERLLRRHVTEINTEIERLAALRAELLGMPAAMPGRTARPAAGNLVPAPPHRKGADSHVSVLRY